MSTEQQRVSLMTDGSRRLRIAVCMSVSLLLAGVAINGRAQVSAPTDAEKATAPEFFRELVTGKQQPKYAAHQAPPGVYPTTGPRDFSGVYTVVLPAVPGAGAKPEVSGQPLGPPVNNRSVLNVGKPGTICVPNFAGGIVTGGQPGHVLFSPGRITIVQETDHRIRRIYLDAEHPKNVKPTYSGDSVGHWDGDTLVVDTIAIRDQENTHLIERIRKVDGGRGVEIASISEDGSTGIKSTSTQVVDWRPNFKWIEDFCEDFGEAFGEGYLRGIKDSP